MQRNPDKKSAHVDIPPIDYRRHTTNDYSNCTIMQDRNTYLPINSQPFPKHTAETKRQIAHNSIILRVEPSKVDEFENEMAKAHQDGNKRIITSIKSRYLHRHQNTLRLEQRATFAAIVRTVSQMSYAQTDKEKQKEIVIRVAKLIAHHKLVGEMFENIKNNPQYVQQEYTKVYEQIEFFQRNGGEILSLTRNLPPKVVNKVYTKVISQYAENYTPRDIFEPDTIWKGIINELKLAQSQSVPVNRVAQQQMETENGNAVNTNSQIRPNHVPLNNAVAAVEIPVTNRQHQNFVQSLDALQVPLNANSQIRPNHVPLNNADVMSRVDVKEIATTQIERDNFARALEDLHMQLDEEVQPRINLAARAVNSQQSAATNFPTQQR